MAKAADIPRWAKPLGVETWDRANELFYEGWQPSAVMRALGIPESKRRSLQALGKKYKNRVMLAPLTRFAEMLAGGAEELGPKVLDLLRMCIEQALSDDTKLLRTAAMFDRFVGRMLELKAKHEEAEAQREREEAAKVTLDPGAVMTELLEHYNATKGDGNG